MLRISSTRTGCFFATKNSLTFVSGFKLSEEIFVLAVFTLLAFATTTQAYLVTLEVHGTTPTGSNQGEVLAGSDVSTYLTVDTDMVNTGTLTGSLSVTYETTGGTITDDLGASYFSCGVAALSNGEAIATLAVASSDGIGQPVAVTTFVPSDFTVDSEGVWLSTFIESLETNGVRTSSCLTSSSNGYFTSSVDGIRIVPEPATMALLGAGAFALLRKRKIGGMSGA